MDKIIRIALQTQFPAVNMDSLLSVINATPNPTMATEMLLEVWEEPKILLYWEREHRDGTVVKRNFVSADFWRNKVTYSQEVPEKVQLYYPAGTTQEQAKELEGAKSSKEFGQYYEYYWMPTGNVKLQNDTCDLAEWLEYQKKPYLQAH